MFTIILLASCSHKTPPRFFASLFSEMFLRAESNPDCAAFRNSLTIKDESLHVDGKEDDDDDDATATALPNAP